VKISPKGMRDSVARLLKVLMLGGGLLGVVVAVIAAGPFIYYLCRVEVPSKHMAVLIKKTGKDLPPSEELATSEEYKGVQSKVLGEGRYFYNPYKWEWVIVPQVEIPEGKLGVRTRLYGDDLPPGEFIARKESEKGIVPEVLRPGRYAINALVHGGGKLVRVDSYAEHVDLYDPITVPAGYQGVVTKRSDPLADTPNDLLTKPGTRGVQKETLEPGTYYVNPFLTRIRLIDCRSQRFNLTEGGEIGFPSKDGFWISLEGIVEFRVQKNSAALVFVTYNSEHNDEPHPRIDEEIIEKVILPNARSYCRLRGSNQSGREFISGETRVEFQADFQTALAETCREQGVEIVQALITRIRPPEKIALPVRQRQIALQEEKQFQREILQQKSEEDLAIEQELVKRKQELVQQEQEVVKLVTNAERDQEVALIEAQRRLKVAEFELKAAEDKAAAVMAHGRAEADVIRFQNEAEAAGWKEAVKAFDEDGNEYARWVLLRKMAPSFQRMMINTADSPIMEVFQQFNKEDDAPEGGAK
jgi:regulator of protease activity HflC (stomatin/prohibitin superfamily)